MMRKKGLSIFQKLFIAFFCVVLITLTLSGVVHYKSKKEFIRRTIASQISDNLHASIDYFNKTFTIPIKKDLGFIEASPTLNNFLTSQKNEALLSKPPVERLLLHFTATANNIYLSTRFIDSKGEEKVVTAGKRRIRNYATVDHFPESELYWRIFALFKRLKAGNLGSVMFEGPFNYKNKLTFVVGISKIEPEIGGFGGAIISHCDLAEFLYYLSGIKFNKMPIAYATGPDNRVIYSPVKGASSTPDHYFSPAENDDNALSISSPVRLGSNNQVLINLALGVPRKIFFSELKKAFKDSALIGMSIILLVGFVAFFISMRLFAKPIKELSNGTERIGNGDLNYRIKIETHDEIAQLADEFNRMAENLQKTSVSRNRLVQEVDERKRTENALRESENLLKATLESTADGILVVDEKEQVTHTNNRFADMWCIPNDIFKSKDDEKLLGYLLSQVKDPEAFLSKVRELYQTPKEDFDTLSFKDGRVFERFSRPLFRDGKLAGRVWSFRDVTEKTKAEGALRKSEALHKSLIALSPEAIFVHQDGNFVFANAECLNLFGANDPSELIGKPVLDIIHPDHRELVKSRIEMASREKIKLVQTEEKYLRLNGEPVDVMATGTYIEYLGRTAVLSLARDITDQKRNEKALRESEERFRAIFEQASIGVAEVETNSGRFVRVNQKYCDIVGYPLKELLATTYMNLTHPDDLQVDLHNVAKIKKGKIQLYSREKRYIRKDGEIIWVNLTVSPIWENKRQSINQIAVVEDITDRKRAESALRNSQKLEGVFEMAGAVCHELNQPMQAIVGYSELLMMDIKDYHPCCNYIKKIGKQVERLGNITKKLANITKYETIDYLQNKIIDIDKSAA